VQSAQPSSHAVVGITQRPAAQRTPSAPESTCGSARQSTPHAPQCATSRAVSVHAPSQTSVHIAVASVPASRGGSADQS
jgi:hypothetical protein